MFIVSKGQERVTLLNKESADSLLYLLTVSNSTDTISKRNIIGSKATEQTYIVSTDKDTTLLIHGQDDAEVVAHWLLSIGHEEVTIKRDKICQE